MFGSANRVSRSASYVAAVVVDVVLFLFFFFVIGSRVGYESWESVIGVSPSSAKS